MLSTYKTNLVKKIQLNSNTYLFNFCLLEPKEIIFKAGQYVILKVSSEKGPLSRLYSIASSPKEKNSFELIVEIIPNGIGSNYLNNLNIGEEVIFQGPAGMFVLKDNDKNKIFMVTGTGIAPARSMIKSKYQILNIKYQIFWGLKYYKDVYLLEELKNYELRMTDFKFKICLSREESLSMIPKEDKKYFTLGHVDDCFDQFNENFDFYLCGGRNMTEDFKQFLLTKQIPTENIIFEKF